MDLLDQLRVIGDRISKSLDKIATEEAAKTAFVMPFLQALGYNIFDPDEVVPEFTADVGTKKGEKVDYAIMRMGEPVILIECKWEGPELDEKHINQLYRYFSVTAARIAVLTNGVMYYFYSDLEDRNKLDSKPFLVLDMRDLNHGLVDELKRLTKDSFDLDSMLTAAGELKYMREIRATLQQEMNAPSDEFVRFFFSRVCPGRRLTESTKDQFGGLVKRGMTLFVKEQVDRRLKSALNAENTGKHAAVDAGGATQPEDGDLDGIVTTEEELEGFHVVKAILRELISADRITYRDGKSYFAILLA